MSKYGDWFDRIAWDLICAKIADKCDYNVCKSRVSSTYGSTPTAITRRLLTYGGRGFGKSEALIRTLKAVVHEIFLLNNKMLISVRWCESFEILDDRGRRVCFVHLAKI